MGNFPQPRRNARWFFASLSGWLQTTKLTGREINAKTQRGAEERRKLNRLKSADASALWSLRRVAATRRSDQSGNPLPQSKCHAASLNICSAILREPLRLCVYLPARLSKPTIKFFATGQSRLLPLPRCPHFRAVTKIGIRCWHDAHEHHHRNQSRKNQHRHRQPRAFQQQ